MAQNGCPATLVAQNVNLLMPSPYHDEHDGYMAKVIAGTCPAIMADAELLKIVFLNLFLNSGLHHEPRHPPRRLPRAVGEAVMDRRYLAI